MLTLSWLTLIRQPARSALAILGIAAVGALLFDMLLLSRGLVLSFRDLLDRAGFDIRVLATDAPPFSGPLLTEATTISIYANRLIAYDATLTAGKEPVSFNDTKEGLFGFRMVDSMRGAAGKIVSSDGHHGGSECWGRTFDWVDYDGPVEGKLVGVAIFDNPHNFRHSRYHVRNYGLFSISPFGEHDYTNGKNAPAPVRLQPGANLRLRYGIYIHDGDTKAADVAGTYRKYLAALE